LDGTNGAEKVKETLPVRSDIHRKFTSIGIGSLAQQRNCHLCLVFFHSLEEVGIEAFLANLSGDKPRRDADKRKQHAEAEEKTTTAVHGSANSCSRDGILFYGKKGNLHSPMAGYNRSIIAQGCAQGESDSTLMLRMRILIGLAALAALALLFNLMTMKTGKETYPVPDVALPLKKDAPPTRLSELKGKVVLLDFWATWCGPCRQSIPELALLYNKYKNNGLEVIGVSVDEKETQPMIPTLKQEFGITYPIVLLDQVPGMDKQFTYTYLPTLYIIDKRGNVRHKVEGYDPNHRLLAEIAPLLDE
jgi:thiol-disulfide isomerase/thioredoxin